MESLETYRLHGGLLTFRKKVDVAKIRIEMAFAACEMYVACSFGKDSLCLLDMVRRIKPDVEVLHMDSGYYLPETYEVKNKMISQGLKVTTLKSEVDYTDIIKTYGLAGINRNANEHSKVVGMLKKDKGTQWAKAKGLNGVFLGIRKDESIGRRWNLSVRTHLYQVKGFWHSCPLGDWSVKDVFAYLVCEGLSYPKFYDYEDMGMTREWIRNSSWVSTDGASRGQVAWLRKHYPAQYAELARRFPEVKGYV